MTEGPAQNIAAERAVLGTSMASRDGWHLAAAIVTEADFYRPIHAVLWSLVSMLHEKGEPADPVVVMAAFTKAGHANKLDNGSQLIDIYQAAVPAHSVAHHARLVADAATLRRVSQAGQRIHQRAEEGTVDPAELVQWAAEQVAAARDERLGVDVLTSDWESFIHSSPDEREMVIPGLLGVGDRLVLTGHGGLGKSTMLQQIAVCAAAGLPPFDWHTEDPYDPVKVAILDFENPNHRVKSRLWPMVNDAMKVGGADPRPNLTVGGQGNSLNLLNPQNALSLLRTIENDKPQLVYIGPVYKMHNDDPDKEAVVKKITDVLDSIRAMGVAIITEAHHTKEGKKGGSLEPSGSNLWTWWPEFGLGLRLTDGGDSTMRRCTLERWRISREAAAWPHEVEASGQIGLAWARAGAPGWTGMRTA